MIGGIARRLRGIGVAISATSVTALRGLLANRMRAFLSTVGEVTAAYVAAGLLTARNRQKVLLAAGRAPIDGAS